MAITDAVDEGGWRRVGASVIGSSHGSSGTPCQDAHACGIARDEDGPVLVVVVGDGAGSSARSDVGSRTACDAALAAIQQTVARRAHVGTITTTDVEGWMLAAQGAVAARAEADGAPLRDYRTTLLLAVIGRRHAAYAQVGDGAIVAGEHTDSDTPRSARTGMAYIPVFWPDNGEYANTTYFVTDPESLTHLQIAVRVPAPDAVALMSDGLQMLALSLRDRSAHAPFFDGMFGSVQSAVPAALPALGSGLGQFLASPAVVARTDDDKTLVLAHRVSHRASRRRPVRGAPRAE